LKVSAKNPKNDVKREQGSYAEIPAFGISTRDIAGFAAVFVSAFIAYWPMLHGGMLWDDIAHITSPEMRSLHGLWRIWFELGATQQYYPLLHSAFWIEHRLWGDALIGYHLTNLLQHCISACLVVLIVRKLQVNGAWLAGWIFALHPVCVEAVAWISEQKSTLSGVFYLAAALVYLSFDQSRKKSQYFAALGLFLLALMSKSVTATLPAALLVVFWWKRGRLEWKRDVTPLLPWFVIGAGAGLFTAWVERTYIGAKGGGYELSLLQHLLLAGRILCFYVGKALWPVDLIFSYPHWQIDTGAWWQYSYLFLVIVAAAGLIFLAVRRSWRGPLAGFLFFAGTLFPVLGFLHVYPFRYSYVADHFQYLALLGMVVPAAWLITQGTQSITSSNSAVYAVGGGLLLILGFQTFEQSSLYRDSETLYRAMLKRNPDSWMMHNNLGIVLAQIPGRLPDAAEQFQESLEIKPDHANAHLNLGNAYWQMAGRLQDAVAEYHLALQYDPSLAIAHTNLGMIFAQIPGRMPEAVSEFETAVKMKPKDAKTHELLAISLGQTPGRMQDALAEYEKALKIDPKNIEVHMYYADTLATLPEQREKAIAQYQIVLQEQPDAATAAKAQERLKVLQASPSK